MTTPTTALAGAREILDDSMRLGWTGAMKRDLAAERALADRIIAEREARIAKLEAALGEDNAGRPFSELLHAAANALRDTGDGSLGNCLREKAWALGSLDGDRAALEDGGEDDEDAPSCPRCGTDFDCYECDAALEDA